MHIFLICPLNEGFESSILHYFIFSPERKWVQDGGTGNHKKNALTGAACSENVKKKRKRKEKKEACVKCVVCFMEITAFVCVCMGEGVCILTI